MPHPLPRSSMTPFLRGMFCDQCGALLDEQPTYVCTACAAAGLEITYALDQLGPQLRSTDWSLQPRSIWRYAALLPCHDAPQAGLFVGMTPLIKTRNLAQALGLRELYVKDDSVNRPSLSYKDRSVAVAVNKAVELGFRRIACVSTGNVATSTAAFCAALGLPCFVVVPEGTELGKLTGCLVYGARVLQVNGTYDDANRLCKEAAKLGEIAFTNVNMRSFYSEGAKTLMYEIAEDLGWRLPQHVVLPLAGGTLLIKTAKAVQELIATGLVAPSPMRLYGAQPDGSAPIAMAFEAGTDVIVPVVPKTIARSLAIGNPGDGMKAINAVRATNGVIGAVGDAEMIEGIKLLGRTEGVFGESSGGLTVALTKRLVQSGVIPQDEEVVIVVSGNGYKTPDPVIGSLNPVHEVQNNLDSFLRAIDSV